MVSVKEAYINSSEALKASGIESFLIDARVILEHILNIESGKLPLYYDKILTKSEHKSLENAIEKRAAHTPVAYITNKKEFYSLDFYVEEGVLIPRGDTELLVSEALKAIKEINAKDEKIKIADLCCGSGCIGLTLAKLIPKSDVTLFDISDKAIEITKKNAERLKIKNAKIIKADILKEELPEGYSLILSNPPYIPICDIKDLEKTVKAYEPICALTDNSDGLTFYKRLKYLSKYLEADGTMLAEIGINQLYDVKNIFGSLDYICDLANIPRVIKFPQKRKEEIK